MIELLVSGLLAISSVCFLIVSLIQYLSCDSCKVKREQKLAKILEKIERLKNEQK